MKALDSLITPLGACLAGGALCLLAAFSAQAANPTYRWVDEKGQVHYGDAMPSQQAGMGHTELDKQGRVLKQAPRTRYTDEEQRQRAQDAAQREEERRRREAQARHDKALLSTYTSEREIDLTRDRAIGLERSAMQSIQLRLDRATQRLAQINADMERTRKIRGRAPAYMDTLKRDAQNEVIQLSNQILERTQMIEETRQRFDQDKARWRTLRGAAR